MPLSALRALAAAPSTGEHQAATAVTIRGRTRPIRPSPAGAAPGPQPPSPGAPPPAGSAVHRPRCPAPPRGSGTPRRCRPPPAPLPGRASRRHAEWRSQPLPFRRSWCGVPLTNFRRRAGRVRAPAYRDGYRLLPNSATGRFGQLPRRTGSMHKRRGCHGTEAFARPGRRTRLRRPGNARSSRVTSGTCRCRLPFRRLTPAPLLRWRLIAAFCRLRLSAAG
jgi:hypothetical protein